MHKVYDVIVRERTRTGHVIALAADGVRATCPEHAMYAAAAVGHRKHETRMDRLVLALRAVWATAGLKPEDAQHAAVIFATKALTEPGWIAPSFDEVEAGKIDGTMEVAP